MRRHKQNVHKIQPLVKPFACSECDFQNTALLTMKQHFLQNHGHVILNHCCYCNKVYGDTLKYLNHIEYEHGLPTKFAPRNNEDIERVTGYRQVETAFGGSLQTYQLKRKITSIGLLELLGKEKSQIQNLIREKLALDQRKFR